MKNKEIKTRKSKKKLSKKKLFFITLASFIFINLFNIAFALTTKQKMIIHKPPLSGSEIFWGLLELGLILGGPFIIKKIKNKKVDEEEEKGKFTKLLSELKTKKFKSFNKLMGHINKLFEEKRALIKRNTMLTTKSGENGIQEIEINNKKKVGIAVFKAKAHPKSAMISAHGKNRGLVDLCISLKAINKEIIKYLISATKLSSYEISVLSELDIIVKDEERDLLTFFKKHGADLKEKKLSVTLKDREKTISHIEKMEKGLVMEINELKNILGAENMKYSDEEHKEYKNNNEFLLLTEEKKQASKISIESKEIKTISDDECSDILNELKELGDKINTLFKREDQIFQAIKNNDLLRLRFEKFIKQESKTFIKTQASEDQLILSVTPGEQIDFDDDDGNRFETNMIEEFFHGLIFDKITDKMIKQPDFHAKVHQWLNSFERHDAKELGEKLEGKNRNEMIKLIENAIGEKAADIVG